jgi:endonuclease/exonuclease/phosphatase family metal-dependent hydrolase
MVTLLLIAALSATDAHCMGETINDPLRVVSFNIRFDNPADGPNAWPHRMEAVAGFLRFHEADIIGIQEALHHQNEDINGRLPNHDWIGVGRDDGKEGGEYSSIFYRRDRFEIEDWGTFWLAENPSDTGAVGWDAAITRIVTWARMRDIASDRSFMAYNTHFDHVGRIARVESAHLILYRIRRDAHDLPVIFLGDLNVSPDEKAALALASGDSPLRDAIELTKIPHYGPRSTWNAFREVAPDRRIDYILVSDHFEVRRHAILTDRVNGRFLSDHLPVFAEIRLKSTE